ncbi:thioesterase domain-containing protein [Shewanella woodyi]|uniref:Thioesterase domain protein n=1 Tax=Shewanella woodyi (strain ATCC 51908 / MS32) TaxID=392500 RepID=B1KLY4_SHEWM|nr:thioesterase domain-containing protein [Shewanella woodyi]ACA88864.1 thioesterase domain protein [Shewanella woodyi ATCC 51908]
MSIESNTTNIEYEQQLAKLTDTWHKTIPVSEFMQIAPVAFDGESLAVSAPLAPNINLHKTMFAGSIYTLATLTGWGMVWLQQSLAKVEGDIVLAEGQIRYLAPIDVNPVAKTEWPDADLSALQRGKRVRIPLMVELWCGDKKCAIFEGRFISLPTSKV